MKQYDEFIERVRKLGIMAMSKSFQEGFPCLERETRPQDWHTGEELTDPWQWKNRAAAEKKLAFGCILGGQKGFVASELYPYFYAACRPREDMEERYYNGTVSQMAYKLYQLFQENISLNTSRIRTELGVTRKNGASKADRAILELQREFYITVSGDERKRNVRGEEYGWAINKYSLVEKWAEPSWLEEARELDREEAREYILDTCMDISSGIERGRLEKVLFGKL